MESKGPRVFFSAQLNCIRLRDYFISHPVMNQSRFPWFMSEFNVAVSQGHGHGRGCLAALLPWLCLRLALDSNKFSDSFSRYKNKEHPKKSENFPETSHIFMQHGFVAEFLRAEG